MYRAATRVSRLADDGGLLIPLVLDNEEADVPWMD